MADMVFYAEVPGHLPSGKNHYALSGKMMFKKSNVTNYETMCAVTLRGKILGHKGCECKFPIPSKVGKQVTQLALVAQVWFQDMRRDVDTILLCDILQKSGVIENDRMIRLKIINGIEIDKQNPRVEFGLFRLNK